MSFIIAVTSFELYYEKSGPSEQEQLFTIKKGQSVASIASQLRELNLIENRMVFIFVVRLKGFHNKIKPHNLTQADIKWLLTAQLDTSRHQMAVEPTMGGTHT